MVWKRFLKLICVVGIPCAAAGYGALLLANLSVQRQHEALGTASASAREESFGSGLKFDDHPLAHWRDTTPRAGILPIQVANAKSKTSAGSADVFVEAVEDSQTHVEPALGVADVPLSLSAVDEIPVIKVIAGCVVQTANETGPIMAPLPFELAQLDLKPRAMRLPGSREPEGRSKVSTGPGVLAAPLNAAPIDQLHSDELEDLIGQELPDATPTEREVWQETLAGMPLRMARDLLRLKRQMPFSPPGVARLFDAENSDDDDDVEGRFHLHDDEPAEADVVDMPAPYMSWQFGDDIADTGERMVLLAQLQMSMSTIQSAQQIVVNNIANLHTPGFKRSEPNLTDRTHVSNYVFEGDEEQEQSPLSSTAIGQGVQLEQNRIDVSQGKLIPTGRILDIAIEGAGFFQISNQETTLFTRTGQFMIDENRNIVCRKGGRLLSLEPAIQLPEQTREILISANGFVDALTGDNGETKRVGQIQLARFNQPAGLRPISGQLFAVTTATGQPTVGSPLSAGLGSLKQNYLESSNVNLEQELQTLQRLQNHYQGIAQAQTVLFSSLPLMGESLPPFPMAVPRIPVDQIPRLPAQVPTYTPLR